MMKITGLSHLFKWENLHNWWLTKYFFAPLYVLALLLDLSCIPELNKTWNAYFIPDLMLILKMIFFLLLWLEVGQGIVIYLSQNDFINISKSPTHSWD